MNSKLFSVLPLIFALSLAIVLGFVSRSQGPSIFSVDSLNSLRSLNNEYGIVIEDLSFTDSGNSPLESDLIQANIFNPQTPSDESVTGLIVSLNTPDNESNILLLRPKTSLGEVELATLASRYQAAIPEFASVEIDQEVELEGPIYDWLFTAPARSVDLSSESEGEDLIKVAVIDSGMDKSHELFANEVIGTGWNTITKKTSVEDDVGHGTHIAGIIAMESEGVEIIPYKIVGKRGGKLSNVIEALSKAIDDDVSVINMSFGITSPSYSLEMMVKKAIQKNIILVAAAGNNNSDHDFYPAEYASVLAVGSVDDNGEKMTSSNYGDWVDVAAPGYHIRSALPGDQYGYKSGTSQATAKVTARVLAWLQANGENTYTVEGVIAGIEGDSEAILEGSLAGAFLLK